VHHLTVETIRRCIENVGYIPRQRNVFYDYIDEPAQARPATTTPILPLLQS
jgi:cyclic dehypoxanthinyl futalosine synthase